jgi:drug/metabolite transporter (DMT)-like permease
VRWNVAVAALAASFGFVAIIVREVDLDPAVLVLYRVVFALLAIATALAIVRRLAVLRSWVNLRYALVLGTTLGVHWFFFFVTIKLSTVAVAVLMAYVAPILVALLGPMVLPERRSAVALIALVPAVLGLMLVALGGESGTHARPLALLTGAGTALTYAALIIGTKAVSERVSAASLTFWNYTFAALAMTPLLLASARVRPEPGEWPALLLLGVVFTALSGYLYITLLRRVTAQTMGLLAYLEPVSAALLAWALVDEPLGWQLVLGGVLVIGAGLLVVFFEPEYVAPVEVAPAPR